MTGGGRRASLAMTLKGLTMHYDIIHHGAIDGVTGSCHELAYHVAGANAKRSLLIDCGLLQGNEQGRSGGAAEELAIDFPVEHVKALVATHVHLDHVGRIPYLLAAGFNGPIYCSKPSAILLPLVIEDALKVGVTRNAKIINSVVGRLKQLLVPLAYNEWQQVDDGVQIRLQRAGHILGSAYVEVQLRYGKTGSKGNHRITFSGDLGAPNTPLLPAPKSPYRSDCLVLESTYGDRNHGDRRHRVEQLAAALKRCFADGGAVLIPAFSIGRTQELLYELEAVLQQRRQWQLPNLRVIVDSPLAAKFNDIYRLLESYWDEESHQRLRQGRHPLSFAELITVDNHESHTQMVHQVAMDRIPTVVVAASGMCAGGRMVNYLKALLGDARTDVLFVGYQAAGTPGRDILEYGPKGGYVYLDGQRIHIKAQIRELSGYSAHAGQQDLINFVKRMRVKPKEIRLVHGEDRAKLALQGLLEGELPDAKVWVP